jgi:transmembrane sensor
MIPSDASNAALREAAGWVVRLREGCGEEERRAFVAWLKVSPVHVQHYLELVSLEVQLGDAELLSRLEMEPPSPKDRTNVLPLERESAPAVRSDHRAGKRRHWQAVAALTACVAVLAFVGALFLEHSVPEYPQIRSAVGELRSVTLSDGSLVTLNTQSTIEIRFSPQERTVALLEGEALFRVARNAARPFRVLVDESVVQAVGTEFNIYRRSAGTLVTVIEGRVAVAPAAGVQEPSLLAAGEQILVSTGSAKTPVRKLSAGEMARTTTWTQRRLVFDRAPVRDIVAQLNRYNEVRLVIDDARLASRVVTGTFDSSDPESFIQFLTEQGGVVTREAPDGTRHLTVSGDPE